MSAERYRFHCTDGRDAVFDRIGRRIQDPALIWTHAERVARTVMEGSTGPFDWSGWIVDVHDANGRRVGMLGFTDLREAQQAA